MTNVEEFITSFMESKGFTLIATTSCGEISYLNYSDVNFENYTKPTLHCRITIKENNNTAQFYHIAKGFINIETDEFTNFLDDYQFDRFYKNIKEIVDKVYK